MLNLKPYELDFVLKFFIQGGYVLDFSDDSFNLFTKQSVGVEVKEKYSEFFLSKGKSLVKYITEDAKPEDAQKLLKDLLAYYELNIQGNGSHEDKMRNEEQYLKVKKIVDGIRISDDCRSNVSSSTSHVHENPKQSDERESELRKVIEVEKLFPHGWVAQADEKKILIEVLTNCNVEIWDFVKNGDAIPIPFYPCIVCIEIISAIVNIDANLWFYLRKVNDLWRPVSTFLESEKIFKYLQDYLDYLPTRTHDDSLNHLQLVEQCMSVLDILVKCLEVVNLNGKFTKAHVAVKSLSNSFLLFLQNPEAVEYAENFQRVGKGLGVLRETFKTVASQLRKCEFDIPGVVIHEEYHPDTSPSMSKMSIFFLQQAAEAEKANAERKLAEERSQYPLSVDDIIKGYVAKDAEDLKKRYERIGKLMTEHMLLFWVSEPTPRQIFDVVLNNMIAEIDGFKKDEVKAPTSMCSWQYLLPEILTYPDFEDYYYQVEDEDDLRGDCEEFELRDGSKIWLRCGSSPSNDYKVLEKVTEISEIYIQEAMALALRVKSPSYDSLAQALSAWRKCNHAFHMHQSMPILESMAKLIVEGLGRLSVDVEAKSASQLQEGKLHVIVDGYSKEGRKEAVQIANTKMSEKDWFSDPNLAILFGSHPNTIANWRKKPEMAPAGFADAWSAKDIRRMSEVARLYKANRERADVMNTKGVKRNMSEEQIHNERLK